MTQPVSPDKPAGEALPFGIDDEQNIAAKVKICRTPPPSALDEEVVRLRSALAHWDSQALAWLGSRTIEAQPGWMVPAIRIGREALGEPFPAALATIKRRQALREMVRLDEEMGLYDDSPAIACQ